MSDVHVLISPDAGRGRTRGTRADVLDRLRALGAQVIDVSGTSAEQSASNARKAVADGAQRLVVLGYDALIVLTFRPLFFYGLSARFGHLEVAVKKFVLDIHRLSTDLISG